MHQIRNHAIEVVQHHGGVINRFAGEEIIALFGIPTPREDDCVRAARALRELHAWLREGSTDAPVPEIHLRSGIDTGLVVARQLGQADQPYRIAGSPLQVAAALALHAGADEVLVSPESRRLLAPFFETENCAPLHLKGRAEPVTPARIVGESEIQGILDVAGRCAQSGEGVSCAPLDQQRSFLP